MDYSNFSVRTLNKVDFKKSLSVFFIVNPTTAMVSRMIIEKYKIPSNNIKIFSFRNTDTSLTNYSVTKIKLNWYDRYLERLFWYSPSSNHIQRELKKINKNFILYTSWAYMQADRTINNKKCIGHVYIEEGQLAYMNIKEFSPIKVSVLNKFLRNWRNRFNEITEVGFYFRNDSLNYVGVSKDSFPGIDENKKIILDNLNVLKSFYPSRLMGIETIGLTCASRRINKKDWSKMLELLIDQMEGQGVIKLHPSFTHSKKLNDEIRYVFNRLKSKNISICPNDVNIELEMLYEKKKIVGFTSSLSKYASIFGSDYKKLSFKSI